MRAMVRQTIETMFEEELAEALGRGRYVRGGKAKGYRNGHRERELVGTFGTETVRVPRARIKGGNGREEEWRSTALRPDEEGRGFDRLGLPVRHGTHAGSNAPFPRTLSAGPGAR